MKRLWQEKRKAKGLSIHEPGPNIVMGANAQVALEVDGDSSSRSSDELISFQKFARYFEVECRLVPISVESKYRLDPKKAMEYVDENTIGVYVILGSEHLRFSRTDGRWLTLYVGCEALTLDITSQSRKWPIFWTSTKPRQGTVCLFMVNFFYLLMYFPC
jgi:hypothetical protein